MGVFVNNLIVSFVAGNSWILHDKFKWIANDGFEVIVSTDFTTDFASIPRFLKYFFPDNIIYSKASVIHDFLYSKNNLDSNDRKKIDKYFLEALKDCKVNVFYRYIMYFSVRIFGRFYFK